MEARKSDPRLGSGISKWHQMAWFFWVCFVTPPLPICWLRLRTNEGGIFPDSLQGYLGLFSQNHFSHRIFLRTSVAGWFSGAISHQIKQTKKKLFQSKDLSIILNFKSMFFFIAGSLQEKTWGRLWHRQVNLFFPSLFSVGSPKSSTLMTSASTKN